MARFAWSLLLLSSVLLAPAGAAEDPAVCLTTPALATYQVDELEAYSEYHFDGLFYLWREHGAHGREEIVVFTVYDRKYDVYSGVEERASCTLGDCIYDHLFEATSIEELLACIDGDASEALED